MPAHSVYFWSLFARLEPKREPPEWAWTHATSKRREQGEDSIYWDESKGRSIGAVSLGFSPAGTRIRKKVSGQTKTEVRDKLRGTASADRQRATAATPLHRG